MFLISIHIHKRLILYSYNIEISFEIAFRPVLFYTR